MERWWWWGSDWREGRVVARDWAASPADEPDVEQTERQVKSMGTILSTCKF